jgi:flagellar protein FlbD
MIKLTRLNQQLVAINPENILWADASPDTTLCLSGGEKVLVRESLDELLDRVIAYQRLIRKEDEPTFSTNPGEP